MTSRAPSARVADTGTGSTSAPSTSHRPPRRTGGEYAGQGVGGAERLRQIPACQPNFVAGSNLGRDGCKAQRQLLDADLSEPFLEARRESAAADEPRARQAEIEVPKHAAGCERPRPLLERIELASGVAAPDNGADRGSGNDVRLEPARDQGADHANMG